MHPFKYYSFKSVGSHTFISPFHTFVTTRSIMAETGFDPRKSRIGEKALCDFIDQEVTGDLNDV